MKSLNLVMLKMSNLSHIKCKVILDYINHLKEIHSDDDNIIGLNKIETALI